MTGNSNRTSHILFIFLLLFGYQVSFAQPTSWMGKSNRYLFIGGIGWGAMVEDLGTKTIFNVSEYWHVLPYPSHATAQLYLTKGLNLTGTANYMRYSTPKKVLGVTGLSNQIVNLDIAVKGYSHGFADLGIVDPFISIGGGYTNRLSFSKIANSFTVNLAIGTDIWVYRNFGLGVQAITKLGVDGTFYKSNANYLEYNLFALYRLKKNNRVYKSHSRAQYKWTKNRQSYRFRKGK